MTHFSVGGSKARLASVTFLVLHVPLNRHEPQERKPKLGVSSVENENPVSFFSRDELNFNPIKCRNQNDSHTLQENAAARQQPEKPRYWNAEGRFVCATGGKSHEHPPHHYLPPATVHGSHRVSF